MLPVLENGLETTVVEGPSGGYGMWPDRALRGGVVQATPVRAQQKGVRNIGILRVRAVGVADGAEKVSGRTNCHIKSAGAVRCESKIASSLAERPISLKNDVG